MQFFNDVINDLARADTQLILLAIILIAACIVIDAVTMFARREKERVGFDKKMATVSIDGSAVRPVKDYVSTSQGLAGRPDAVIIENGFVIPVERKPLARKLRDRYVAQLLVYMRLIEEFEGKKPPYGYLILGPQCRKFKIENSEQRQEWLQDILNAMRSALHGSPTTPAPHPRKCAKCDVSQFCTSAHLPQPHVHELIVQIKRRPMPS